MMTFRNDFRAVQTLGVPSPQQKIVLRLPETWSQQTKYEDSKQHINSSKLFKEKLNSRLKLDIKDEGHLMYKALAHH